MSPFILRPRCNRRVTCDSNRSNDWSESATTVSRTDAYNLADSSKRFSDPHPHQFSLATYASSHGGISCIESPLAMLARADSIFDPEVPFDRRRTWRSANHFYTQHADKQSLLSDTTLSSPYYSKWPNHLTADAKAVHGDGSPPQEGAA